MRVPVRAMHAALAVVCAAGVAACGTTRVVGTATVRTVRPMISDPLADMSSTQIATKTVADLKAASTLRMRGNVTDSGSTISFNLALAPARGCQGSMTVKGEGSFKLVYLRKTLWLLPDDTFYRTVGGVSTATLSILSGKYLRVSSGSSLKDFAQICNLSQTMAASIGSTAGTPKGIKTTFRGQRAMEFKDPTGKDVIYVSDTATPEMLRVSEPSSGNLIDFSAYNVPVKITEPPSAEVIDGAKYGF